MNRVGTLAILVLLILLYPVITPKTNEPEERMPEIHWGLGLNISAMPAPAPFMESRPDLVHLFEFANASIEPMLGRCETDTPESWVYGQAKIWNLDAFGNLADACDSPGLDYHWGLARQAQANGTEASFFAKELTKANATMAKALQALKALPMPGNAVDAAFQSWLFGQFTSSELHGRQVAIAQFQYYLAHKGEAYNDLTLKTAVREAVGARFTSEALAYFATNYEWQKGSCVFPSLDAERARATAQYNYTLDLLNARGDPNELAYSSPEGFFKTIVGPQLDYFSQEGFLVGLVEMRDALDYEQAYWENVTLTTLPTADEGVYLSALQHSKLHSLSNEGLWFLLDYSIQQFHDHWKEDPKVAVMPIAMQAMTWDLADICTGPA